MTLFNEYYGMGILLMGLNKSELLIQIIKELERTS